MKIIIISFLTFFSINVFSQEYNLKTKYLFWTFHAENTTVNGISFGAFPNLNDKNRFVKTNGIRLEIPGIGFLAPLGNGSPISRIDNVSGKFNRNDYEFDEIINGLNISTGTVGKINYNGITIAAIAQFGELNNGIALAGMWNAMDKSNGIQISLLLNETLYSNGVQISLANSAIIMNGIQIGGNNYSKEMYGIQIGILNKSKQTKGLQIGIWNINEKRKFPIFNWNFEK
ncbi:hypothetical protein DMB65_20745 [Flavobacterium cheongpyeongense]|uniref:Uncharacterized protein n=1 Tax=Flavobacterium cheongpyeongense TaxID=2212651 RepID=A0A2V4BJE9_9FLAO|nr:hypothetical protein [Flavobacterium cheongpyeongense]PXY38891.1 hypothetical protein DMB65_20745 [Flavobacterium cheongpyeongense]